MNSFNADYIQGLLKPIENVDVEIEVQDSEPKIQSQHMHANIVSGRYLVQKEGREIIEVKLDFLRDIPRELIDVGSSFSLYPHNSKEDVDFIINQFNWNPKALIGNYTVEELLINEIDIKSERLKLNKFMTDYDLEFLHDDLKKHPYLTLY